MAEKKYLSVNEFKSLLLARHEEYKNSPEVNKSNIIPNYERAVKILLNLAKEEKIKAYHVYKDNQEFTFIEVYPSKLSEEEMNQVTGISTFVTGIENRLGLKVLN